MLTFSFSSHEVNWDNETTLPELQICFDRRLQIKDGGSPQVRSEEQKCPKPAQRTCTEGCVLQLHVKYNRLYEPTVFTISVNFPCKLDTPIFYVHLQPLIPCPIIELLASPCDVCLFGVKQNTNYNKLSWQGKATLSV